MHTRLLLIAGIVIALAALVTRTAGIHFLPLSWTGEHRRLADAAGLVPGSTAAEIGAGSGRMAEAMSELIGPDGRLYVTELDATRLAALRTRFARASHVTVVEAAPAGTALPDGCCAAIYMRNVLHHVDAWPAYASDVVRALQPAGRVVVIDFAPGAMWHLGSDHGADPARVIDAFTAAGLRPAARIDAWGGGMYLLRFDR